MTSWKTFERRVAKDQGTSRTPLSGSASRHTSADTLHALLYSEAKYRKHWAIWSLFEQVKGQVAKEGKIPRLYLKEAARKGYLVCFHVDDWVRVMNAYNTEKKSNGTVANG